MSQRSRLLGAAVALLLLGVVLSGCGAAPVAQHWPGLSLIDGNLYVISGQTQQVYNLDAETGAQKGTFVPSGDHREPTYWSPVTVGENRAYVGFSDPQSQVYGLYAFDPESRQEQWHTSVADLILGAPEYADGLLYFGVADGSLYAVDAETGQVQAGWPFEAQEAFWASPLVDGGRVYAASMDHHLYCLDAASGQLIWSFEAEGALAAAPILEDGILYFGAFDGRVYALRADSGEEAAGLDFRAENWIWSEPVLADGVLYVTSLDGKLYALDPASGAVQPGFPFDAASPLRAAPVLAGDLIIVTSQEGKVSAINKAGGTTRWQWPSGQPEAEILTTPIISDGTVYLVLSSATGTTSGKLYALEAETAVQQWFFEAPTEE